MQNRFVYLAIGAIVCLAGVFYYVTSQKEIAEQFTVPLGLPKIPWPEDNPYTAKKAELGRLLYFDKRLSSDNSVACATCHSIPKAFSDRNSVSTGILGRKGTRHSPTVINTAYLKYLFWDGRASSLEEQSKGPIANPKEMTVVDDMHEAHRQCHEKIKSIPGYRKLFKEVFGTDECSIDDVAKAIATFERTVLSGNSPFDKYMAGDTTALTEEQVHGYKLFHKVGCQNCHFGPNFTDSRFFNIGIGMEKDNPDLGRYDVTKNAMDWGSFKTPTIREAEHSYPYMHDGRFNTLEEVMDYYNKGGYPNKNLSQLMRPLNLSEEDKKAIISFMKSLSGEGWQHLKEPNKFPE